MSNENDNKPISQLTAADIRSIGKEVATEFAKPFIKASLFILLFGTVFMLVWGYVVTHSKSTETTIQAPWIGPSTIKTQNSLMLQMQNDLNAIKAELDSGKIKHGWPEAVGKDQKAEIKR